MPGHGLRRGAAVALSGRRAAIGRRYRARANARHHRRGEASRRRRRDRHLGRGDAGGQAAAQGDLDGRAGAQATTASACSTNSRRSRATRAAAASTTHKSGDVAAAMQGAAKVFRGEYRTRYVYHAQMEPLNATAAVSRRRQVGGDLGRHPGHRAASSPRSRGLLQTEPGNITVPSALARRRLRPPLAEEVVLDAVRLSKAVGKPVKLIWSREDDMTRRQVPPDRRASHRGRASTPTARSSPGTTAWSRSR